MLHIFPSTEDIYENLQQIQEWDHVTISGREILKIDLFDSEGNNTGFFIDLGCNSILVTSVKIEE